MKTGDTGTESEVTMGVATGLCPPFPAEDSGAGWEQCTGTQPLHGPGRVRWGQRPAVFHPRHC